jgi:hypothetical protein
MNRAAFGVIGIVAALLVAGLVAAALYLGPRTDLATGTATKSSLSMSPSQSVVSSTSSTSHCSTPIPPSNQSQTVDIYQIAPGSTGSICVDYEFESGGTYSVGPVDPGTLYVSSRGYSYQSCGATNINGTCPGLDITPSPAEFNHQAGEVVAVSFTVQTAGNASGLYLLFVSNSDPVILAVGPVVPSSMPIFGQGLPGPPTPVNSTPPNVTISGVSNIKVAVVPLSG